MSQPAPDDPDRPYFATAARGTEGALRDELRELRIPRVRATRGGVYFGGGPRAAFEVCLQSRIAIRVLERQATFEARDEDALYAGVSAVPWERVLDGSRTLCVDALVRDAASSHSVFVAQRVKDAVVDRLRAKHGARPNVDLRDPDVRIVVHWIGTDVRVLLDMGGASLHARGYRAEGGQAPLRETLAAAVLRLSGWDRTTPLIDPMCGSGTLAIEAAQWALGMPPGLLRKFGFERWASHDDAERRALADARAHAAARSRPTADQPLIMAHDCDSRAIEIARRNAARAGVRLELACADVRTYQPSLPRAWLVTNPPYGERLAAGDDFTATVARTLITLHGYRVCILAPDRGFLHAMPRRPALEHQLWNGAIECRLLCWSI